jgi:uncharacterized membrane protein YhaH (DUF805 family)
MTLLSEAVPQLEQYCWARIPECVMTDNPYAPPKARVEEVSTRTNRASRKFWVRFYLSPFGRTGRLFYWLFGILPLVLISFGFGFYTSRNPDAARFMPLVLGACFWPQVVMLVRRLHDLNLPGWWVVLFWVVAAAIAYVDLPLPPGTKGLVTLAASLVLGLIPGTDGANRYDGDPRGTSAVATAAASPAISQ